MKNDFRRKYLDLEKEVSQKINSIVEKKGKEGTHARQVVKIKDDQQFNLDGGRYLVEISHNQLLDNNGYGYQFSCLTLEQLCEIVDSLS